MNKKILAKKTLSAILLVIACNLAQAADKNERASVTPTTAIGATVFQERCVLCHSNNGMGEGHMTLLIKDYPSTNLLTAKYGKKESDIRKSILYGGAKGEMNSLSPPWSDELSWIEIESVVLFVKLLHTNHEQAMALLQDHHSNQPVSKKQGRIIFAARCSICHGQYGEGDGKMRRIIKSPPPYNLTQSGLPDKNLKDIITNGGEAVGRSPQMPPWGKELTESEILSVIAHIKTLREH
ncbi:MAG: c-type cytochrome [Gammaproteobacteria bacterium]|nr:c-type cytochrome [Gammaproteobacteria bacterium]